MDPITQQQALAAAGAAGGEGLYVDDVFSTYLYEGNNSTQTITNGIDLSGEGGLVWIKGRGPTTWQHIWVDTVRGATKHLSSNSSTGEQTAPNTVPSFSSTGFTAGTDSQVNYTNEGFASWTFRKAPGFFDVVTYTGDGVAGRTVAHNLGSSPGMIVVKRTDTTGGWWTYHRSLGATQYLSLNNTTAALTGSTLWNDTNPTSSVFSLGTNTGVNASGGTYVAYLFAHDDAQFGENEDESIIKCGSYTGTTSGVDLNLGFEPQWVMIKRASGTASVYTNWYMFDNMRGVVTGGTDTPLAANLNTQENGTYLYGTGNPANLIEFSSTGIRVDPGGSQFTAVNTANEDYIYIAIRRPHKPPESGTDVFAATTTSSTASFTTGFPVDMNITKPRPSSQSYLGSRLTGNNAYLVTHLTDAEASINGLWDFALNTTFDANAYGGSAVQWSFRRAPGFFDMVAYTGTGVVRTVDHNLTVAPELMIFKKRNGSIGWVVYHQFLGASNYLFLNSNSGYGLDSKLFNSTAPTASNFTVGTSTYTNASSDTYIAYLFASLPGISKVGSYIGTGSTLNVDCGFTAGARFVLIKRMDNGGTGDWYVWDSTRGIVSGNDPYLLLNSTAAEVTSTDYIDPLNSGFTVTSSAPTALNASGGTYIFLAIA